MGVSEMQRTFLQSNSHYATKEISDSRGIFGLKFVLGRKQTLGGGECCLVVSLVGVIAESAAHCKSVT